MNVRSDAHALQMRYLGRRALFDRNMPAVRDGQIKSRNWRRDIKRHIIFFCQHRNLISANLVRGVAIRRDPVGSR